MAEYFGIFRDEGKMKQGLSLLDDLRERCAAVAVGNHGSVYNQALIQFLELEGMLLLAESVGRGALMRRESRGSHARTDYPKRDDEQFMAQTIARLKDGNIAISTAPVTTGMFEPKERVY